MSTELATLLGSVPSKYDDNVFGDLAKAGDYLPYLSLFQGTSKPVKQGKIPMAHYGLTVSKDNIVDLGENIDVYVLAWRPKAIDFSDDTPVSSNDPADPIFQQIAAKSGVPDSNCQAGPEFLLYLPSQKTFATMLMGGTTAKMEAPKVKAQMGKACNLTAKFIEKGKNSWHGPVARPQSAPIGDLPDAEKLKATLEKFLNPPAAKVKAAEPATATEEARPQ